ncbi:MAG TPA: aminotransferase class III-fold pyridoxal phosphate-dependent enzyme, partial [Polyangiaceae bacterium]|nr:aminotransferase class III-fold pyridoxal phosphate-dependent enzyme [Polyangiaceae bacterium]
KALAGGLLPFAATLVSERIFDGFLGEPERAFFYGHTYCGNPLGARVALEVLRVYDEERVLEGARARAAVVARAFENLLAIPGVTRTRALGMIGAADLGVRAGYLEPVGQRVYREALARGAYLRPLGNTVYVAPPLNIPEDDLSELLDIVEASVRAALA